MPNRICPHLTGSWYPVLVRLGRSDIGPSLGLALAACIALSAWLTLHSAQTQPRSFPLAPRAEARALSPRSTAYYSGQKARRRIFGRKQRRLVSTNINSCICLPDPLPAFLPTPEPAPKRLLYRAPVPPRRPAWAVPPAAPAPKPLGAPYDPLVGSPMFWFPKSQMHRFFSQSSWKSFLTLPHRPEGWNAPSLHWRTYQDPGFPYLQYLLQPAPEILPTPDPCPKRPLYPATPIGTPEASKPAPAIKAPADTR